MSYVMGGNIPSVDDFKKKKPKIKLGKTRNADVENYWEEIYNFWKDDPEFPFSDLNDMLYQVHNYVMLLESFLEDKIKLSDIFVGKDLELYSALENITTDDSFENWWDHVKKVTGFKVATLDANHMNADDIMKNSIFDADQIPLEEKERKKQTPRIAKEKPKTDDTSTMDSLF